MLWSVRAEKRADTLLKTMRVIRHPQVRAGDHVAVRVLGTVDCEVALETA